MKILRVGDPHVKVSNLDESEKLMAFICETAKNEKVDRIELLGDQFHTHAVLRLEVVQFWERWLDILSNDWETVVNEGNHDQSGDYGAEYSALTIFQRLNKPKLHIITKPRIMGPIGYIPYMHDGERFINVANEMAQTEAKVLVCHQTIMGSKYESGIFAHDGIDSVKISEQILHIISGHIHSQQEFGRIDYPGTARWDSVSDANLRKGIWIYDHENATGRVLSKRFLSTETVCSPLYQFTYKEGEVEPVIPANARVSVELVGTSDWIAKEKVKFKGKASIKSRFTDSKKFENRKAGNGLEDFIVNIYVTAMDKSNLLKYAKELGIV